MNYKFGKAKTLITVFSIVIVFCNCRLGLQSQIGKATWLLGTWENKTPKGTIYESWERGNKDELKGKSYLLKENDTIILENVSLIQDKNDLYYIPTVKNQNGGLPVRFKLVKISPNKMIFENKEHDFPKTISYQQINKDSIYAEISGRFNGKERKQAFPMKRVKLLP